MDTGWGDSWRGRCVGVVGCGVFAHGVLPTRPIATAKAPVSAHADEEQFVVPRKILMSGATLRLHVVPTLSVHTFVLALTLPLYPMPHKVVAVHADPRQHRRLGRHLAGRARRLAHTPRGVYHRVDLRDEGRNMRGALRGWGASVTDPRHDHRGFVLFAPE